MGIKMKNGVSFAFELQLGGVRYTAEFQLRIVPYAATPRCKIHCRVQSSLHTIYLGDGVACLVVNLKGGGCLAAASTIVWYLLLLRSQLDSYSKIPRNPTTFVIQKVNQKSRIFPKNRCRSRFGFPCELPYL